MQSRHKEPIAVGETLRRLTAKCLCALVKVKASAFFQPLQSGIACTSGSEKVVHGLRKCIDNYWDDEDFAVLKTDMRNAFNLVSRDALLQECAIPFFLNFYPGHPGAIVFCGIQWVTCLLNRVYSKEIY